MSWRELEEEAPELAALGFSLLDRKIAFLGTLKKDGSPRLHPVRPVIGEGHLFIFIDVNSPKRSDLLRDGRYTIHGSVTESNGLSPEFMVSGVAELIESSPIRALAVELIGYVVPEKYALFEFSVNFALVTKYTEKREPIRYRWKNDNR